MPGGVSDITKRNMIAHHALHAQAPRVSSRRRSGGRRSGGRRRISRCMRSSYYEPRSPSGQRRPDCQGRNRPWRGGRREMLTRAATAVERRRRKEIVIPAIIA
ncbi:hypothetical protein PVAP13_9NG068547 [Panicum virgatum]|uniref:Uncharacterized protein n=1 Tax=Panicum virgatum TaxID=38727 RepID=A0A8T0MCN9_PANVG|nr:hypothetical protein PVAP13_9NG068547 [Panicum virgatum]